MKSLSSLMQKHVVGVVGSAKVSTALMVMRHARVPVAPVLDEQGRLIGLLTREAALEKANADRSAEEAMLTSDVFVEEKTPLDEAGRIMVRSGLSRLAVVDSKRSMHVLGTVTATAIAEAMQE